jgi:hypothetical protein
MADRIPMELIHEILLCNAPPRILAEPHYGIPPNQSFAPLLISRMWYSATIACPQLWTHIDITTWHLITMPSSALELWLERSGQRSIYITVEATLEEEPNDPSTQHDFTLWNILVKHVKRWKSFSFQGKSIKLATLNETMLSATALEELSIMMRITGNREEREHHAPSTDFLPALTLLSLENVRPRRLPPLNGTRLTRLHLHSLAMQISEIQACAQYLPNVQELKLHDVEIWGQISTQAPQASKTLFPHLQKIILNEKSFRLADPAIANIIAGRTVLHALVFEVPMSSGQGIYFFNALYVWRWYSLTEASGTGLNELVVDITVRNQKRDVQGYFMKENIARAGFERLHQSAIERGMQPPKVWRMVQTTKHGCGKRSEFEFRFAEISDAGYD